MKLGKKPARPDAVKLKLANYLDTAAFPTVPKMFGHEQAISDFGVLGNDQYGDCVWAGGAHEVMIWNKECGKDVIFTPESVLSDYSAVTGFDPNDPNTDQGTDMQAAASYRQKTGIVDAKGVRHKIGAYLAITPGNIKEHLLAAYLFGAVGIGIRFPNSAMTQFNAGKRWAIVKGAKIDGGHYIPFVAKRKYPVIVTWGKAIGMTEGFFKRYNDESVAYVSEEMLSGGKSPEGFDLPTLLADLKAITQV